MFHRKGYISISNLEGGGRFVIRRRGIDNERNRWKHIKVQEENVQELIAVQYYVHREINYIVVRRRGMLQLQRVLDHTKSSTQCAVMLRVLHSALRAAADADGRPWQASK